MRRYFAALAIAAIALPQASQAAVGATASLSNLNFQLIDLDLTDGMTPTFRVAGLSLYSLQAGATTDNQFGSSMGPLSGAVMDMGALLGAQASVGPSGFSVSGYANVGGPGTFYGYVTPTEGSPFPGMIFLSANSLLKITGDITVSVTTPHVGYYTGDQAQASVVFDLDYNPTVGSHYSGSAELNLYSDPNTVSPIDTVTQTKSFTMFFANVSDVEKQAFLYTQATVSGVNATTAVPEADSVAMAAAGLLVAGGLLRRRRLG